MNKSTRIALGSGVLVAGLAFAGASPASAQVRFEGSFPLPHGRISIGVGQPAFTVGGYVPEGYAVYDDPQYGWGFYAGDQWVNCEQSGGGWIVVARPTRFAVRDSRYERPYGVGREFVQETRRGFDNRAYERPDREVRSTRNVREFRDDRMGRDDRGGSRSRSNGDRAGARPSDRDHREGR